MEPLILGTITGFILLLIRWIYEPNDYYFFLPYNLLLALIPLGIALMIVRYSKHKQISPVLLIAAGFMWLIFFPNAPYVLTDFIHLAPRHGVPIWFDAILILSFASSSVLAGWYSLWYMQILIKKWFDATMSWVFVAGVLLLASFGVYLGRFLRWNSWDLFLDPVRLATDVYDRLSTSAPHTRFLLVSGFFLGFFLISYASFFVFMKRQKHLKI